MSGERGGTYAEVNGLQMYYEIHGTGSPLLLLHGAFMTIGAMRTFVPLLAEARRVIAVELQVHGHTADGQKWRPQSDVDHGWGILTLVPHYERG